jgi:hypothetical protein
MPGFESLTNGDIGRKKKMLKEVRSVSVAPSLLHALALRTFVPVADLAELLLFPLMRPRS